MNSWTADDWVKIIAAVSGLITLIVNTVKIQGLAKTADNHTADIRSLNEQATTTALATPAATAMGVTAVSEPLQTGGSI